MTRSADRDPLRSNLERANIPAQGVGRPLGRGAVVAPGFPPPQCRCTRGARMADPDHVDHGDLCRDAFRWIHRQGIRRPRPGCRGGARSELSSPRSTCKHGLAATYHVLGDLPPLRSAQFSFMGPAGGEIALTPTMPRRGKYVRFAGVDLPGDTGLAARAVLAFGAPVPPQPSTAALPLRPSFGDTKPIFARHFAYKHAAGPKPLSGASNPEFLV
jgi:hypothetical protein